MITFVTLLWSVTRSSIQPLRQEREIKGILNIKEEKELFTFLSDTVVYAENPNNLQNK